MGEIRMDLRSVRISNIWISPEDCKRLLNYVQTAPEPSGCHVRIELEADWQANLLLKPEGHCDSPAPVPDPHPFNCILDLHCLDNNAKIEGVCVPQTQPK